MNKVNTLIIGAGPAGLAVAGRMRKQNLPFTLIEQNGAVGSSWRGHYDRLHLHTVKQLSHLPHLPFPDAYPRYVSRQQVVDYLDAYADHFDIQPIYNTRVQVVRKGEQGWVIDCENSQPYLAQHVVMTTGTNRLPNIPHWEGEASFGGKMIHSKDYKNPNPFLGQKVLVVGIGNTGAEVALDLSEHGVETCISVRGKLSVVPRDLNGRPVQLTAKQLDKLPWGLGDWIGTQIRKVYFGDLSKYGLQTSTMPPIQMLRETGKTPLIDIGTIAAIKAGKIKVVPEIKKIGHRDVHFSDGTMQAFDSIILATGYRAKIEDIVDRGEILLDTFQYPKYVIADGYHEGLYFVGFDNYKTGGLLGTIYNDSETVVNHLSEARMDKV